MNWIINFIFVLSLAGDLGTAAKGTMLKCGEDIVVGRGAKKSLRFWSSEDELMKVEIFSELPPKKANDASALLSIFKNIPPKPIDSIRGSQPTGEINKRVTFPPAYRTSDLETQNVAEISRSELSKNSNLSPPLMTQDKDDLFHPGTRDEITESIRSRLNQIKLNLNESSIVEDTLAAIRDRITTFKEEIELTTMPNDNEVVPFGIQPVTEEQKVMEAQPEAASADLLQKAENEKTEQNGEVTEDLNNQIFKFKEVTSDLDEPADNVAVIRNQIIKLMEDHEKTKHELENTKNNAPPKLSKSEVNTNQLQTIEKIRAQITKLKESGENLENLEEIISGVKKQILNLKESIIPVTKKENVIDTTNAHVSSDLPTDILDNTSQQNEKLKIDSDKTDKQQVKPEILINQEKLTIVDPVNIDQVKHNSDIIKGEINKSEMASTSTDILDQKETKKSEGSNLAQVDEVHEVTSGQSDDVNSDMMTTSDVEAEIAVKTTIPKIGVKDEYVNIPIAVKDNLGNEDEIGIVANNDAIMKPEKSLEQVDDVISTDESDVATEDTLSSSQIEDSVQNKEKMKKPNENQPSAVDSNIQAPIDINVEQTSVQKQDSENFDHIQSHNDVKTKPSNEVDKEEVSQVFELSIVDSNHPVTKDKGYPEKEAVSNEPKNSIIQSETQTKYLEQNPKLEDSLPNSSQDSMLAKDKIETPKEDTEDSHAGSKSATDQGTGTGSGTKSATKSATEEAGTKSATEEGTDIKSATEEGTDTKSATEEAGKKSATEEGTGTESGTKSATEEAGTKSATEVGTDTKPATEEGTDADEAGTKSTTEEGGTKSSTEEAGTKSATEVGIDTKLATEQAGTKSATEQAGTKSATEEGIDTDAGTKLATEEAGIKSATEEGTGTESGTQPATEEAGTKSATEVGTDTKKATEEGTDTKSATEEGIDTEAGTKSDTEEAGTKAAMEVEMDTKSATKEAITKLATEDVGTKSKTEEDASTRSATGEDASTKLANEEGTNTKSATVGQTEKTFILVEKTGNEKNYQQNKHDTVHLEVIKINSGNAESELPSKVQDLIPKSQPNSVTKNSEKENQRKGETTDENLKSPEHEHIAISIPKKILESITNLENSGIISDDQPATNENIRVNDESSDIHNNDSEKASNYPTKISNENRHSTESDKSAIKIDESLEKPPILPEIVDTLKKIDAEKPKLVEKTIPKIILESLHKDSSTHTIDGTTATQPINIQSDTEIPTQSKYEKDEKLGTDHSPEAELEFTKLEQESIAPVETHPKGDIKTRVEINSEDLPINETETDNDSQVTDKVRIPQMNSVNPKLENENEALIEDIRVLTTENKDKIEQKVNLESHSHHLDKTDHKNPEFNFDDIGHHNESFSTSILTIDEVHDDEVQSETSKVPEQNDFQTFDDEMQASKIRMDGESEDPYKKPLIEMDYDGAIQYNEELENKHNNVIEVPTTQKESDVEKTQQTPEIQSVSHHIDETLALDINNQSSNQEENDTDKQHFNEKQKIKVENNEQNIPTMSIANEPQDINFEPKLSYQYETDIENLDHYYDDFHDTNKETSQMDDESLKVNKYDNPEKFLATEHSNQSNEDSFSKKENEDERTSQEHSQLINQNKSESGDSYINNSEKLKASEIQSAIVRLIEGSLNSAHKSAHNHKENESKNNIPSTVDKAPNEFYTDVINPENKKDLTAAEESSDIGITEDIAAEIPNFQNSNDASIRKDEIANEKLSEILAKLNEKRVNADNNKIIKPIEIYPEDIGYDETKKEYINANINILKSIVNQVAIDLAVNKKEAESKIESNLKPINFIYKPDDENTMNENIGIIDYYSDPDSIPAVNHIAQPVKLAPTGDSLKESPKEENEGDTKTTNQEEVPSFDSEHEQSKDANKKIVEESPNLDTETRITQNTEITKDEKPTGQIQISRDRIYNLINTHKAENKLQQDSPLNDDPTKEMIKDDTSTVEQNKKATTDEPANSKSNQDVNDVTDNKQGEISIPFGFLNWFGKESAAKIKAPIVDNEENGKITTWTTVISDNGHRESTTPFATENNLFKMEENDDQFNITDITNTESSAIKETETLNIMKENSVFSKETGSDNIISHIRDSAVKQQANQVQKESHSEIPIPFSLANLQENASPKEPASTKPVIIKEHESKVIFFTPDTNSVGSISKNDENIQENSFNQVDDYALETTTQSTSNSDFNNTIIFMKEESSLLESGQINKDQTENMEDKTLLEDVVGKEFHKIQNDENTSPESKMNSQDNEPQMEISTDSTNVQDEEPELIPEELLHSDQINETAEDTLELGSLLEDSVIHSDEGPKDGSEPQAEITNKEADETNFLSILEKYVIDESPVNSYIPEEIYHSQGTEDGQENYNININNHNYQRIPINRFTFNNNDYENVRRRIDENMQDTIQYENRRHDNNPPSDIYQSGSSGPSLSSLLQTRKGFIGPSIGEGHSSQGGAQLRRVDSQHTVGGDSPFFIKLPGSPNAVPVFLQYEPVQVRYVDPEKLKKKNPSLKNDQPILPLFKKNVTSNSQRANIKITNTENKLHVDTVNAKIEDERANEIKSKPDPFFIMEAPDLGKDKVSTDPTILDKPESSPLITDDSLSVNLKGHLNFNQKDSIPSTIIGSKSVYPGEYVMKNPDSSYSSSDTQTLSNRVFDLGAKGTIPNSIPENPQYTPFPLTTNPPRTESISTETAATSTTKWAPELPAENIRNKTKHPQSVDYVTIPSINFNESFDGIAYPDLPLTERLRDDYGFLESDSENANEKEDNNQKTEDQLVPEIGLFATPKTGLPPKEEEFDIVALANFLHQNQKVWSNNNMAPMSEDDGSWRGPVWNNLKYSNVNGEDSWPQPLGDSPWLTNEEGQANARDYTAFYSPEEIPGLDPLYFSYRQMPTSSREPRTQGTEVENIKTFIEKLPIPLKAAVVGESAPIERSKRAASFGEKIYCEWNFKTEPGLYLLVTFTNLSAPFTVDCYGAYIEVERESNGYGARWCGHRASLTESRQHVIFAKHQVRVSVYDNGDLTKNQVTGFEAEIEAIDLFDSEDYDSFMRSKASSKIRRLMEG